MVGGQSLMACRSERPALALEWMVVDGMEAESTCGDSLRAPDAPEQGVDEVDAGKRQDITRINAKKTRRS